jgi:hypothetical protein
MVQVLVDANYSLTADQSRGLLFILDALIDLGDRRSAALEQSEAFRRRAGVSWETCRGSGRASWGHGARAVSLVMSFPTALPDRHARRLAGMQRLGVRVGVPCPASPVSRGSFPWGCQPRPRLAAMRDDRAPCPQRARGQPHEDLTMTTAAHRRQPDPPCLWPAPSVLHVSHASASGITSPTRLVVAMGRAQEASYFPWPCPAQRCRAQRERTYEV